MLYTIEGQTEEQAKENKRLYSTYGRKFKSLS